MASLLSAPAVWASLAHFLIDVYSGAYPLTYPVLAQRLGLSVAQVGIMATTYQLASALPLAPVGYLTDRVRRWPGTSLPVLAGAWLLLLLGWARSFPQALLLLALAGLASAALHPYAAKCAALADRRLRASALSLFIFAGNAGFTLGPLLASLLVGQLGDARTLWLLLPVGLAAAWLARQELRLVKGDMPSPEAERRAPAPGFLRRFTPLAVLLVARTAVFLAVNSYLPLYLTQRGWSLQGAGLFQGALLAGVAVGGLSGGWISRRVSLGPAVLGSSLLTAPALLVLLWLETPLWPPLAVLTGWLYGLANPLTVDMGQRMNPAGMGTASGVVMSASFIGAVGGVQAVGWLGQLFGLQTALLWWLLLLPLGVLLSALGLQRTGELRTPTP